MSAYLLGSPDASFFPDVPDVPRGNGLALWREGEALLVEPLLSEREFFLAEEVLGLALPFVEESVSQLCADPTVRRAPATNVHVTTSALFAKATGPAAPGGASLSLVVPIFWRDVVLRNSPTSLDGGRHVVVHAERHVGRGRPGRVLALRTIPRPYETGPPDAFDPVFQLAWARLDWPETFPDDDSADDQADAMPSRVTWDPVPRTVEEWLAASA